jgi:hypothetical protein
MAEITDLNIKVLVDAGRPWEAAAAGRLLPSLARLRWEGFTVSVAAVRKVDLETTRREREFLGGRAKTALLSCIEGEGEPPLELLLAAVACAGSGEVRGIPVQMMRDDSVSELDLRERNIGVEGGMLLAYLVPVMGGLTSINLSGNYLCGIRTDSYGDQHGTYTAEGITAITDALRVNGGLTKLSLAENELGEEGTKAIGEALEQNKTLKELDISKFPHRGSGSNIGGSAGAKHVAKMLGVNGALTTLNLSSNEIGGHWDRSKQQMVSTPEGPKAIADALLVNGGLTALDLSSNDLKDEGVRAVCEAIQSNKETKLASLNFKDNGIGPVGANTLAAMVAVTGALTVTNLLGNQLDEASTKILAEVAKQKGISLCGIQRDQTTADFSNKFLKPPDAILLASDLSQAVVTGGLTSINLSRNQLCGIWEDYRGQQGTYTAEGITAIADALCVNGALTQVLAFLPPEVPFLLL